MKKKLTRSGLMVDQESKNELRPAALIQERARQALASVHAIIGTDLINIVDETVEEHVARLSPQSKRKALRRCAAYLDNARLLQDKRTRSSVGELLVFLIPDSFRVLEDCMMRDGRAFSEIRFAIFCCLDDAPSKQRLAPYADKILALLSKFLMQVPSQTAQAAWKAADVLADHWVLSESLPMLSQVAMRAQHVAGREAALSGFATIFPTAARPYKKVIIETLNAVAVQDRSKAIRNSAKWLLR